MRSILSFARRATRRAWLMTFVLASASVAARPPAAPGPVLFEHPLALAGEGNFYVGGHYADDHGDRIMVGQMYVQYQIPAKQTHKYPLVLIHGGGQTGAGYWETPDGREGWATYFVRHGYAVYVVDQVARGRSGFFESAYGDTRRPDVAAMTQRFSRPQDTPDYPQAQRHTQWPGEGKQGDVVFDQFFASQVEDIADVSRIEDYNRAAGAALLDRIGPAVLLVHSQSGPIAWGLANDRPEKVRAIVAVEPSGPAFYGIKNVGAPDWFKDDGVRLPYGVTRTRLDYAPAVDDPAQLKPERAAQADGAGLVHCWKQAEPAHRLVELAKVPDILILGSESSYHVPYDRCTSDYLTQAGVRNAFVRLPDVGIHGNGHMMMLEKNSLDIARYLDRWIASHGD